MAEATFLAHILVIAEEADRREQWMEVKTFRDALNPFHLDDSEFLRVFRLSKFGVRYLCDTLRDRLQRQRRHGIAVETQVLAALRFFAVGKYQRNVGRDSLISLSQPTMSRAIRVVAAGINEVLAHRWIKFPRNAENRSAVMDKFQEAFGMRRILGCLDTCHIGIVKPGDREEGYYNSRGYHSLNVQIIVSSDMEFLSVNSRYPGSVHKSFIWQHSAVRDEMKRLWDSGETSWLVGNSNYPQEPWLLTPIANANGDTPEGRFNQSVQQTRKCVDKALYTLLTTFQCLRTDKVLHYKPIDASTIVIACIVLHNLRVHLQLVDNFCDLDEDEVEDELPKVREDPSEMEPGEREEEAEKIRTMLIQNYWQ